MICFGSRREPATLYPATDPPTGSCPVCGARVQILDGVLEVHGAESGTDARLEREHAPAPDPR